MNIKDWFGGLRTRADSSYTDALIAAITANAGNTTTAFPTATAALEACAGFYGRAFAASEISAPDSIARLLTPDVMQLIGRSLIRRGEIVYYMSVRGGVLDLMPCAFHDIDGEPNRESWTYRCTVGGPERTWTYDAIPGAGVLHFQYANDVETPWRGVSPLGVAMLAGRLSAETAAALADESGSVHGSFVEVPVDPDATVDPLKADIKRAKGALLMVEAGDYDNAGRGRQADYKQKRFGADPPASLVALHTEASGEVYAACGLNETLFRAGQGSGAREAYRQALFSAIAPLGMIVQSELRRKFETEDITIDWTELRASDIVGRARAFKSLVESGVESDKAAALSGLLLD